MRGFISSHLPDSPDDWVCVVDFCGNFTFTGYHEPANFCADWSPSRAEVRFGGQWHAVPPMPAVSEPSEDEVHAWVEKSNIPMVRRHRAIRERNAAQEARMAAHEAHYKAHGFNFITVTFRRPDGSERVISEPVGRRTALEVLPCATGLMLRSEPRGTKVARFVFETGVSEKDVETWRKGKSRHGLKQAA